MSARPALLKDLSIEFLAPIKSSNETRDAKKKSDPESPEPRAAEIPNHDTPPRWPISVLFDCSSSSVLFALLGAFNLNGLVFSGFL